MTTEQFDTTKFCANMPFKHKDGNIYICMGVNYEEHLIRLQKFQADKEDDGCRWVRCENVQIINP